MKLIHTRKVLLAGLTSAALLATPLAARAAGPGNGKGFDASAIPISSDREVANPMRGQYQWHKEPQHNKTPELLGPDQYERMFWNEVETSDDVFDTSKIDAGLARAAQKRGTYGFRVMSVCDWCSADMIVLPPQLRSDARTWVAKGQSGPLEIPDWNSEKFLSEWEELMAFLGKKYADDPRLGYIDVGGYGNWGEWHSYPFESQYATSPQGQTDITLASSVRLIRAVVTNFPHTNVVLSTTGSRVADAQGMPATTDAARYEWSNKLWQQALAMSPKVGLRNDCLGAGLEQAHAKEGLLEASRYARATGGIDPLERWKTAPFVTEWCGATKPPKDLDGDGVIEEWERHDYTGDGKVEDWELESEYGSFDKGLAQVEQWHISLLSSDNYRGQLSEFPQADQDYFRQANLRSGYRYEYARITARTSGSMLSLTSTWRNVNVAPTYHSWSVVYELRRPGSNQVAATLTSKLDLRTVLPGAPVSVVDTADLRGIKPGAYQVSIKVVDPRGYFAPMALGVEGRQADGSYPLGKVVLNPSR